MIFNAYTEMIKTMPVKIPEMEISQVIFYPGYSLLLFKAYKRSCKI